MKTRTSPLQRQTTRRRVLAGSIATACALLAAPSADATTFYWDSNSTTTGFGTAGGTWNTTGSSTWQNATLNTTTGPAGTGAIVSTTTTTGDVENFGSATVGLAAGTISVGTVDAGNIIFGAASGAITLSGGTITLGASSITVNNTSDTITSLIGGTTNTWSKAGAGTLILTNGSTTRTGTLTISAGTLQLGDGTATGSFNTAMPIALTVVSSILSFKQTDTVTQGTDFSTAAITGLGGITQAGSGTLVLNVANSYSGPTAITAGTLVAGDVQAFGTTSAISLTNGTTGGKLQLSTDTSVNPYAIGGNTGAGAGTVVSDRATAGAGITHVLGAAVLGNNTYNFTKGANVTSGTAAVSLASLNLSAGTTGTLILNPTTADLAVVGAVSIGSGNVAKTLQLDGTSTGSSISGAISNGLNTLSLTKAGTGTWTLSGPNTYTGNTTVTGGTLNITGTLTGNTTTSTLALGTTAAKTVVNVSNNVTLFAMTGAAVAGSNVAYNQSAGTVNVSSALTMVGTTATTGSGSFNLTGGTFNINTTGNFLVINDSAGSGSAYVGGTGTLNIANTTSNGGVTFAGIGSLTVGPGGTINRANGGAAFYITAFANATGIANVAGGNFDLGTSLVRMGNGTTITGMNGFVNLAGGTLTMGSDVQNLALGANLYANFAGGTLKASANLASPFSTGGGVTTVSTVFGPINNAAAVGNTSQNFTGGLTVDTNNNSVTYGNALRGATGNGVAQTNMTVTGGTGYIGAPTVTFTGGTLAANGTPASGYAVISGGAVTGVVITSPGTYTVDPTVTLTGGGGTGASVALSALAANAADTGLSKIGLGTLTLTAANTYNGATLVSGGTLTLSGTGAINSSSGITVNGSGAKLLQASSVAVSPTVSLTQGTLTGSGTFNTVNVANAAGNVVSNNNGVAGAALTIGALTFEGAATVNTFSNSTSAPIVTTALASNVAGSVIVNPTGSWVTGTTYDLISYGGGSIGGGGFGQFTLGTVTGLVGRQTASVLTNSGTAVTLAIGGEVPYWVGDGDAKWNLASTNNWKLLSNNAYDVFKAADDVLFNDNATGAGPISVDIDTANVAPNTTTFNNSAKNYVLSGAFGISSGSLTKTGTGTVTIGTVNTYTGATNINGGTVTLSGSGTLGSGSALTLGGGKLDLGGLSPTVGAVSVTAAAASGATIGNGSLTGTSYAVSNSTGTAIISANLLANGAAGFTKTGAGTVTLSGANAYTGATVINDGTVKMSGAGTLGAAGATGSAVSVNSGALLDLNGTDQNIKLIAGTGVGIIANNSGSGTSTLTLSGTTTINGSGVTIADSTTNPGGKVAVVITFNTQPLNNLNTYSGGTTVNAGAFLYLNSANPGGAGSGPITLTALGAGGTTSSGLVVDGVTYANDLSGAGYVHNNSNGGTVTTTFTGNLNTSGPFIFRAGSGITYSFAGDGTTSVLSGVIGSTTSMVNGAVATGKIIKSGTGTLSLSGANVYTGGTTLSAGVLNINSAGVAATNGPLGNGGTFTINGGTIDNTSGTAKVVLNVNPITVGGDFAYSTSGGTSSNDLTLPGAVNLGAATRTVTTNGTGSLILSGVVSNGSLTKTGSGNLQLSNATNTYAGATSVKAGALLVSGSISGSAVTVGDSASLATSAALTGAGIVGDVTVGAAAGNTGAAIDAGNGTASVDAFGVVTGNGLAGKLTTGAFSLVDGAHFSMQLGGTTAGTNYDQISATSLSLAGDLQGSLINGFTPANGQVFFIAVQSGGGAAGAFSNAAEGSTINLGGQAFQLTYLANWGGTDASSTFTNGNDVALMAVPEPGALVSLLGGLVTLFGFQRRRRA